MTNLRLAEAFLERARVRLQALEGYRPEADLSDVIREAREIIILCFRGMLRVLGIEVSRWGDVGEVMIEHIGRLPQEAASQREQILEIYADLRRERIAYMAEETVPPEKVLGPAADRAIEQARWVLELAQLTLDIVSHRRVPANQG